MTNPATSCFYTNVAFEKQKNDSAERTKEHLIPKSTWCYKRLDNTERPKTIVHVRRDVNNLLSDYPLCMKLHWRYVIRQRSLKLKDAFDYWNFFYAGDSEFWLPYVAGLDPQVQEILVKHNPDAATIAVAELMDQK